MGKRIKLSGREADVMNVFWEADRPLIAKDIVTLNPELSINTVQAVLKVLLKKNCIQVAEIVYSGTVLTRSYEVLLTAEEYMVSQIADGIGKRITTEGIVAALLDQEKNKEETIQRLESLLEERRKDLK